MLEDKCHSWSSFPLCAPMPQEVMLKAGNGAVKGKQAANAFELSEVTGIRKEVCSAATGTTSLCLFSLSVSRNRFRGKERVEVSITWVYFEEPVPRIYRNSGCDSLVICVCLGL